MLCWRGRHVFPPVFLYIVAFILPQCQNSAECSRSCTATDVDCFLVDEHSVVVADETGESVGRPLGRVCQHVMEALVRARVFHRERVVDYQGICRRPGGDGSAATTLHQAVTSWAAWVAWAVGQLLTFCLCAGHHPLSGSLTGSLFGIWPTARTAHADTIVEDYEDSPAATPGYKVAQKRTLDELRVTKTRLQPCDMATDVYHLRHPLHTTNFSRKWPFSAATVPGSNLLLVAAWNGCVLEPATDLIDLIDLEGERSPEQEEPNQDFDVGDVQMRFEEQLYVMEEINMTVTGPILKTGQQQLRRRPTVCYKQHVGERQIVQCGRGSPLTAGLPLLWTLVTLNMFRMALF